MPLTALARAGFALLAAGLLASAAHGQSIERNLPPGPTSSAPAIAAPAQALAEDDATPLGPKLRAVVLLGPTQATVTGAVADGVSAPPGIRLDTAAARRLLEPMLGRPLSRRLIAEVQGKVVAAYRAAGFPFLSVSTPVQDITDGVLQVRLIEFHLQAERTPGVSDRDGRYIQSRIRQKTGDPIDANVLSQDLDWLDRYPFRSSQAVFSPGTDFGGTVLNLQTQTGRPFTVYAGYADSGSPLTGTDRYFVGGQAGLPWLHDAYLAYQGTTSDDALFAERRPFHGVDDPRYVSHGARLVVPTFPRQAIEASLSYVRTTQGVQDFTIRQNIVEATLAYRSALSNLWRALPGELAIGVEATRQHTRTLFGDDEVAGSNLDDAHVTFAYAQQVSDRFGRTEGEVKLHVSPGGVNDHNTDFAFAFASQDRVTEARFGYLTANLQRLTRLPPIAGLRGWTFGTTVIAQYSPRALPLVDAIGLGGDSLVRGYTLDDGAFDSAVIIRNELRAPAISPLPSGLALRVSPFASLDLGYGRDQASGATKSPLSVGVGGDVVSFNRLSLRLAGAVALSDMGRTRRGDSRLESRATLSF